jgi:hypothetical protein
VRIVIASNDVVPLPGEPSLDLELDRLASETLSFASEAVR